MSMAMLFILADLMAGSSASHMIRIRIIKPAVLDIHPVRESTLSVGRAARNMLRMKWDSGFTAKKITMSWKGYGMDDKLSFECTGIEMGTKSVSSGITTDDRKFIMTRPNDKGDIMIQLRPPGNRALTDTVLCTMVDF